MITRHVAWQSLTDLLREPPRAYLAGLRGGRLQLVPVEVRCDGERFSVRDLPELAEWATSPVRLTIDDGIYWFELRAVTLRGELGESGPEGWRELRPDAVSAWDYGQLREEEDAT